MTGPAVRGLRTCSYGRVESGRLMVTRRAFVADARMLRCEWNSREQSRLVSRILPAAVGTAATAINEPDAERNKILRCK